MKRSSSLDVQSSPTSWEYSNSCLRTAERCLCFQSLSKINDGNIQQFNHPVTPQYLKCNQTPPAAISAYCASRVVSKEQETWKNQTSMGVSHTSVRSVFCTSPCRLHWVAAAAAGGSCAFLHSGCRRKHRTDPSSLQISSLLYLREIRKQPICTNRNNTIAISQVKWHNINCLNWVVFFL